MNALTLRLNSPHDIRPLYIENAQEQATQARARSQMRAHTCIKTQARCPSLLSSLTDIYTQTDPSTHRASWLKFKKATKIMNATK